MHIADLQFGDNFYEVDFDTDSLMWGLSFTRPEFGGTVTHFYSESEGLMDDIRANCPPVFESMVRKEVMGDEHA